MPHKNEVLKQHIARMREAIEAAKNGGENAFSGTMLIWTYLLYHVENQYQLHTYTDLDSDTDPDSKKVYQLQGNNPEFSLLTVGWRALTDGVTNTDSVSAFAAHTERTALVERFLTYLETEILVQQDQSERPDAQS
jgi:hypothetical protein